MPLKIPTLPLDTTTLEVVSFVLRFNTKTGFFEVYEQKLSELWPVGRSKKRGVKTKAYEATESLHLQIFGHRRYADKEVFFNAYSNWQTAKV
ncbi:hypothetical protein IC229_33665 [Spirosoma sp. BT702]|uniref:Uncharacterized protein n=1 Tax=Spirosoma profusum TaxID=2771354 RepID=A0A927AW93_9BACT|nr:hypothetical protein [Spirosoma profusum]MBD2705605.1 hypothetical protein [Spirosoma profusum]